MSDFHCVTTWSRYDNHWSGVRFKTIAELAVPKDDARHSSCAPATTSCPARYIPYTTNLPLARAIEDDVLLVHTWEGMPLPREHGGPCRMITPKLYAWKGTKWIRKIEFLTERPEGVLGRARLLEHRRALVQRQIFNGIGVDDRTDAGFAVRCEARRPGFRITNPAYDGIRAIADVCTLADASRLWSRLGNEKTAQFRKSPEALERWAARRREPVVLDGEIVALDGAAGRPTSFQNLQGRIHLGRIIHRGAPRGRRDVRSRRRMCRPRSSPSIFCKEGPEDLRELPLTARREALEKIFSTTWRSAFSG